jgi:hypothetical protein
MRRSDLARYLVTGVGLLLLVLLTHWRRSRRTTAPATPKPTRRTRAPTPCAGSTRKPAGERCAHAVVSHPPRPGAPPPRLTCPRGRRRQGETTGHFCPHPACASHGRGHFGNRRAHGHPNGRRWRPLVGRGCRGDCFETVGTPLHVKQVDPDQLVSALAALAEGLGLRAVARVFEADPQTVLGGVVEAAAPLERFTRDH